MGPNFPNGAVGAAHLLMRLQAAMAGLQLVLIVGPALPWSRAAIGIGIAGLILGFHTRTLAVAGTVALLAYCLLDTPSFAMAGQAVAMAALALLGAGAYSIDALLFGRREIRFRP